MSESIKLYSNFHLNSLKCLIPDLGASGTVIKVALCDSAYSPNQNSHDFFDDITHELSAGSGYSDGGATLTGKAVTISTVTTKFDANDVAWDNSSLTARYAIIYYSTGTAATSPLIGYVDFGADKTSVSAGFNIVWNASGIFTIAVA